MSILSRIKNLMPQEPKREVELFGARWDQEKQPGFFMDLIDHWKEKRNMV